MSHGTSPVVTYCSQNRFTRATFCSEIRPHPALKMAIAWVACDDAVVMVSPAASLGQYFARRGGSGSERFGPSAVKPAARKIQRVPGPLPACRGALPQESSVPPAAIGTARKRRWSGASHLGRRSWPSDSSGGMKPLPSIRANVTARVRNYKSGSGSGRAGLSKPHMTSHDLNPL